MTCGKCDVITLLGGISGVTMGGGGIGGTCPPPWCPPIQNFEKIGPHLRLQDTKCSSIDMPPLPTQEKVVHPLVPPPPISHPPSPKIVPYM